jgi:predicted site-specific integrase-resolvase
MTLLEAAAIAGVTPQTLKEAAQAGTLKARNPSGRLWVTTEAAVRDWMATRRRGRRPKHAA